MSKDPKDNNHHEEQIAVPDLAELWKEMYFQAEATWADAVRQFASTKMFTQSLNNLMEQYLSMEKIKRQSVDLYMENTAVPSKKDVARVAELVVSLEEKVDNIEFESHRNMQSMVDSLVKLVDIQEQIKKEFVSYHESLKNVEKKLDDLNNKLPNVSDIKSNQVKSRGRKRSVPKAVDTTKPE